MTDHDDITPQAELERGQRMVTEGITLQVRALARMGLAKAEWVDQHTSPLGRRNHLELARSGAVESRKVKRLVLIRKADVDDHIERTALKRGKRHEDENVDDVIERITGKR